MSSDFRDHIGPYRLLKQIRSAKTTQIWEAMNAADQRRVALKVLRKDYAKDRVELAQLRHEFEVGHTLDHPAVNRIHDLDASRDLPFIVMDYFRGANLKQAIREQSELVAERLPEIVQQCAAGLGHMHAAGWVHRDIKPDNFLVNSEAQVKLIDFAIAQKPKKGLGKLLGGKTSIQGTRSYMAPEQIRGGSADPRSDIYSLGCTYYELCTGKPPFTGSTADDLLTKHLKSPPPLAAAVANHVTPQFSQLIAKMMAKKMDQRPQSMEELVEELDNLRITKGPVRQTTINKS